MMDTFVWENIWYLVDCKSMFLFPDSVVGDELSEDFFIKMAEEEEPLMVL